MSIPKELLNLTGNRDTQERLRATYRLISEKSELSSKEIEKKLAELRRQYVISLGERYGNIILRKNKAELIAALQVLSQELETFATAAKAKLDDEFTRCREELMALFLPIVMENPPDDLRRGILTEKPTHDLATKYLQYTLRGVIPDAEHFIGEMKLEWLFKDVTYEMLSDDTFQQLLKEKFPYVSWEQPFEEQEAALASEGR